MICNLYYYFVIAIEPANFELLEDDGCESIDSDEDNDYIEFEEDILELEVGESSADAEKDVDFEPTNKKAHTNIDPYPGDEKK